VARVQLVFDTPICASPGDAFIARDAEARHTLGGGVVTDPGAPARRAEVRAPRPFDSIERLLSGEGVEPLLRDAERGIEMRELVRLCGRPPEQIALPAQARIVDAPGDRFGISRAHWLALCDAPWARCGLSMKSSPTNRESTAGGSAA